MAIYYYYSSLASYPNAKESNTAWTDSIADPLSIAIFTLTACATNKGFLQSLTFKSTDSKAFHETREKNLMHIHPSPAMKKSCISPLKFHDTLQRDHSPGLCLLRYILAAAVVPFLPLTEVKSRQAKYVSVYQFLLIPKSLFDKIDMRNIAI